jgi:competence protein ComEC
MSRRSAFILFLLVGVALGARVFLALNHPPSPILQFAGRAAVVEGVVADDLDVRAAGVRATVAVSTINGKPLSGKILAVLAPGRKLQYGDSVSVRGLLEEPQSFETQTGRTFDYQGYLQARGISAVMQRATLQKSQEGSAGVLRTLFVLKHAFERALERVMQEPMVSLMEGFLLGEKSNLPQALTQAFVIAGLIHVVVLSGYNIGVVSEWTLQFFAFFLPRRVALAAVTVVIVLFALMAGGGMATIRACLMGLISILGRYLQRPTLALRSLGAAVVVMGLYNPLVFFDIGFVLSVLATFGLITLGPFVETKLRWLPEGGVRSTAATTIAVQLFVLPALLYYTGVLSFVSVPANVIFLPFVPLAMLLGFVAGMLALIHPFLALVPALAAGALLRAMLWVTEVLASLPFAAAIIPTFPWWVAVLFYIPLTAWASSLYRRSAPPALTN